MKTMPFCTCTSWMAAIDGCISDAAARASSRRCPPAEDDASASTFSATALFSFSS